jgi:NHLM bacteriocin system ABC transporter ATP-binding protein
MSGSRHAAVWTAIQAPGEAKAPEALEGGRRGPILLGVCDGAISLVVRSVRADGRLGPPEAVCESGPGGLLAIPPDEEGWIVDLRVSHDARVQTLAPPPGAEIDSLSDLEGAVRSVFEDSERRREWIVALGDSPTWTAARDALVDAVVSSIRAVVASAAERSRSRVERLRQLDDESLNEAIRFMADPAESATARATSFIQTTDDVQAALRVLEALDVPTERVADLQLQPDVDPVAQVARRLHLQYREVKLEGRWWREQAGPLLARTADGGASVALLPKGSGYIAYEHRDGAVRRIDRVGAAMAAEISPDAVMFYRPLPSGPVRILDLLRLVGVGSFGDLAVVVGITLATSGLVALVPILTGMIVGTVIPSFEQVQLLFVGAMLVVIALSKGLVHVMAGIAFLRIETRSSYQVIAALVDRVLQLPASYFRDSSSGDLTQRVMAVEQIRSALTQSILSVVISFAASLSNLGILFYYDVRMALTAIGVIAVELVLVAWLTIGMSRLDYRLSVAKGGLDGFGVDLLMGIRQVRIQGSRSRVLARFLARLGEVGGISYRAGVLGVWLSLVVGATSTIALALVFVEFTGAVRHPGSGTVMDAGGFVAFVTALSAFLGAVVGLAPAIKAVAGIFPQLTRIRPILSASTEIDDSGGDAATLRGGVSTRGLRFRYAPELPWILDGVDIEAKPGEFIALVGRTGCGKSTLLSVLLGLERPVSGQVLYDDLPLENLDASIVRSQVGVVMQSSEALSGNVQSTILGVGSRRTLDDAWAAARTVGMADEIDRMPMGMLTMIGPTSLSQSQLQRLLIARALVSRPEILFLDEATSALDNASQAEITRSIDQLGATRIVIAHRLSTIRNADRIYVLDRGRVVQSGTFDELVAEGGHFGDLMAGQTS